MKKYYEVQTKVKQLAKNLVCSTDLKLAMLTLFVVMFAVFVMHSSPVKASERNDQFETESPLVEITVPPEATEQPADSRTHSEEYPFTAVVTESGVRLRKLPDTRTGTILAELAGNTKVTVLSKKNEWYYVNLNGQNGYIHSDFILPSA